MYAYDVDATRGIHLTISVRCPLLFDVRVVAVHIPEDHACKSSATRSPFTPRDVADRWLDVITGPGQYFREVK